MLCVRFVVWDYAVCKIYSVGICSVKFVLWEYVCKICSVGICSVKFVMWE